MREGEKILIYSHRLGIAPVPTDPDDPYYCQCTVSSNNTGELLGMWNALQWAKRQGGDETFAIVFDSMYACNVTRGLWMTFQFQYWDT